MKASIYIKNYLVSDIILVTVLSGVFYLVSDILDKDPVEEEMTVELVPINVDPNEDIS